VTREGDSWLANVQGLTGGHTYAKNLIALRDNVDEVIRLVEDLDDDAPVEQLWWYVNVDEALASAGRLGQEREQIATEQARLLSETHSKIVELSGRGVSVRDIAGLLRVSPGRVSQVTKDAFAKTS
jgi:DNA-binding NarL/FixJ family response regulator